ncbi:RNB domain-containing ribonuclease [Rhodococcus sp. Leaf233]|uniref:RNB domain-containing ribonuclease n=1 Tax=Rhodococcus sp. Leaf233 TaxID=1736302 RepID=UPI00070F65B8|nr:RNB domain-containing ribonuclease [Rhodococcus sp. Leaf233]KQU35723.1 hypothetical protein ASH04_23915 [Rhodococcus sp. Leaf233]
MTGRQHGTIARHAQVDVTPHSPAVGSDPARRASASVSADVAPLLMIDGAGSRDRDDAVTAVALPGGGWAIEVHIAAVADVVRMGSRADEQAFLRGETRYLRTRTIPMLGPTAEAAATLTGDENRTTMCVNAVCGADGTWREVDIARASVPAGRCVAIDHESVKAALDAPRHPLHATVIAVQDAAHAMLAARRDAGALAIYDLSRGWATSEEGAPVAVAAAERTVGYLIVQEFMIAANRAIAYWAAGRGVQILFRTHRRNPVEDSASAVVREFMAAAGDPGLSSQLRERLSATALPARYEGVVAAHHGLRLACYTHATSPLRRLADLISQRAVFAYLDRDKPPYTSEQLTLIGDELDRRARQRRENTAAHHKAVARAGIESDATGDLAALDPAAFTKVLAVVCTRPPQDTLAEEVTARAKTERLTIVDVVALLSADHTEWRPVAADVVRIVAETHPHWSPSVTSGWNQSVPDGVAVELEDDQSGPAHAPEFAARGRIAGTSGAWTLAATKKRARQDALWSALEAYLDGIERPDDAPTWSHAVPVASAVASTGTPLTPAHPPHVHDGDAARVADAVAAMSESRRARAFGNPVAWLMSFAANIGVPAPVYDTTAEGPSHARQFVTAATFVDHHVTATAPAKSVSRTAAAEALLAALLESIPRPS